MSEALIEQFKKDFPHFSPLWINVNQETIIEAVEQKYCTFDDQIIQNGLVVYKICFDLLWKMALLHKAILEGFFSNIISR